MGRETRIFIYTDVVYLWKEKTLEKKEQKNIRESSSWTAYFNAYIHARAWL